MRISRENKLEEKISKLQRQLDLSKKEVKSLRNKLSTSERKRKSLKADRHTNRSSVSIALQPVKRHKFSSFIVSLSVLLYVRTGCGFRGVVRILSVLKEVLCWDLVDVPTRNSIENWVKKSGLHIYNEPKSKEDKEDYALIVDESMMIGSQKLLLTLGAQSQHDGSPLSHSDVSVLGMSVRSSWNSQSVCSELEDVSGRLHHPPAYVISDNASVMNKGIRLFNVPHIRDISHTLGMFMERVYKNCDEFHSFMKELSQVKFREVMNPVAYLLPPKQRSIARFMNLSQVVNWSEKILMNFTKLTGGEKKIFSFVPRYASLIDELRDVVSCVRSIEHQIKHNGLSHRSMKNCINLVKRDLSFGNERMIKIAEQIVDWLSVEIRKLPSEKTCWNASSDIIESIFGVYKNRKSPNPLHGVTTFVLLLPLHTRIGTNGKMGSFDFKNSLESVFMSDIERWKKEKLTENLVYKRIEKLKAA
jgi:hypothetical protein